MTATIGRPAIKRTVKATMLMRRNLKLDLFALALIALNVFLGLALATYDPADPPGSSVYPPHAHAVNACGRGGAWAADMLFDSLGWSAWYVLVSLVVVDIRLLARRPIAEPWLRAGGWLLSLVALATLSSMLLGVLSPGPAIGAGGYLGAAGRTCSRCILPVPAHISWPCRPVPSVCCCVPTTSWCSWPGKWPRFGPDDRSAWGPAAGRPRSGSQAVAKLKDDCEVKPPVVDEPAIKILGKFGPG